MQEVIEKQITEQTGPTTLASISEQRKIVRWDDLESQAKGPHTRRNLIDLCRNRDLSCHKTDPKPTVRNTSSEERTQTSSTHDLDSFRNSPIILSSENEEDKDSDKPLLNGSKIKTGTSFTSLKSNSKKSSKFFCQPSYKLAPKISELPEIDGQFLLVRTLK